MGDLETNTEFIPCPNSRVRSILKTTLATKEQIEATIFLFISVGIKERYFKN